MKLDLTDIIFIVFAAVFVVLMIWELIPDSCKKYWKYTRGQK